MRVSVVPAKEVGQFILGDLVPVAGGRLHHQVDISFGVLQPVLADELFEFLLADALTVVIVDRVEDLLEVRQLP